MRARFVLAMAWRETRAARRRLFLFASAISIGVAALVAISSFTANLETAVRKESRSLLGADLGLSSNRPFTARFQGLLDSTATSGVPVTMRITFSSMAYVPQIADKSRLADVRAVGPGFPFYGDVVTSPAGRWHALDTGRVALVDTSLLVALGAHIGDSLVLGNSTFGIAGTVTDVPGRLAGGVSSFGSQVYIPARYTAETGLIVFGSRVSYQALLKFQRPNDAQRFADHHGRLLRDERIRVQTAEDTEADITRALDNMSSFLEFVGLIALLLGGIGVASGITAFLAGKNETIAVLRCIGARRPLIFAIYLTQAVGLGLVAAALGSMLGAGIQLVLPQLLKGILPLDVRVSLEPQVLLAGIGIGVGVSVLFALRPLLEVRLVSPLQAIRKAYESEAALPRDPARLAALGLLAAGVLLLCMMRNADPKVGVIFALAIGASVLILTLTARLIAWTARKITTRKRARERWPYVLRQGLANLHRPRNQTRAVLTALGFGVGLLAALYLVQSNLLRQVSLTTMKTAGRPNLVFIDIQPDQAAGVRQTVLDAHAPVLQAVPIIPMRIAAINGRTVQQLRADTGARRPASWTLRRDYRSTFRDTLINSEKLTKGALWHGNGAGKPDSTGTMVYPMSLSTDVATDLHVDVGDRITWDVQGQQVATRVMALRDVDWARFEPNFFAVLSSAALDRAPSSWVVLTRIDEAGRRALLQRAVAEKYSNVIAFDVAAIQQTVERIFNKVALAVRFMAGFSLATGALVLLGAVSAGRIQRIREGALLKALGATRRQLSRILLAEYLALGGLAALVGIGIASLGAWSFVHWVLKLDFAIPVLPLGAVFLATAALVAVVGLTASREVFRRTAMEVLRDV
ncbi:MAG TPA: FtsX-like permease family protein [Gemmatimonadales bacterium]|jgi:putative ABC transport system permease protein